MWNHSGTGLYPGDWDRTCRLLANSGFNAIFPFVASPAVAHYSSKRLLATKVQKNYGDQLAQCLAAAHRYGMEVHAWKICWNLESAPPATVAALGREGRLQMSDTGKTFPWLCPSHPDNQKRELEAVMEIARKYPVDGIQLDYIRYKDSHHCFCNGCRKRFEKEIGRSIRQWPKEVKDGPLAQAYDQWRAEQINHFVALTYKTLKAYKPRIKLSAAVYGYYPQCSKTIAQDWGAWLSRGYIDFVCPMNYTTSHTLFTRWVRNQTALTGARGKLFPGIGVTAIESRLSPLQTVEQILILRREGAGGFVLFDLTPVLEGEILPALRLGVTAQP